MIEQFLNDQQDPRAIEKVYSRLVDLLSKGEEILYIAAQKKPVVNLMSDCVAITNKRLLFFTPANFGLSMKFVDFVWKDILDVQTREEILGAVFSCKTVNGAEMGVDYLPKIQARKLYQYAQERKEEEREARRLRDLEDKRAESGSFQFDHPNAIGQTTRPTFAPTSAPVISTPDFPDLTQQPVANIPDLPTPPPQPAATTHDLLAPTPPPIANNPYLPTPTIPPIPESPVIPALEPIIPPVAVEVKPDELTEKLQKLKKLFDHSLISQEEYNHKKMQLLEDF